MNYAQAKRAIEVAFKGHAFAISNKKWPNVQKCRVYVAQGTRHALIGAGSNWEAAVEMAFKAVRPPPTDPLAATAVTHGNEPLDVPIAGPGTVTNG